MPSDYATVSWDVDDIVTRARERNTPITTDQALTLISKTEREIRDTMRHAAYIVIDCAIDEVVQESS